MLSTEVQQMIPTKNQEDIRQFLISKQFPTTDFDIKLMYLMYLITKGDFENTCYFLTDVYDNNPDEVKELVSTTHPLFHGGSVLHIALYWNAGQRGIEFFELFVSYGAHYIENDAGYYAWEQFGGIWSTPFDIIEYGVRMQSEFDEGYEELRIRYHLHVDHNTVYEEEELELISVDYHIEPESIG
jgi:hypothetical protein